MKTLKVLLIEDDEDDYTLIKTLLSEVQRERFQVDWVKTYQEGVEAVCRRVHDVYLLDFRLGEQDGLTLLKETMEKGCEAPLILLTGQGDYEVDLEAMRSGAADYLIKDQVTSELLERSIRYSIERNRAEAELKRYRDHLKELVRERTAQLREKTEALEAANEELHREIAERTRAEEALKEGEEKYRTLVDSALDIIFTVLPDGTISSLNPAFELITGWPAREWIGKKFSSLIHPDDLSALAQGFKSILGGESASTLEVRVLSRSGTYRAAELKAVPQVNKGKITGVIGTARDVTERRLAEEKVLEQGKFLTDIFNALSHPFYVLDANDYTIKMANSAAAPSGLPPNATCYAMTHRGTRPCGSSEHFCPLEMIKRTKEPAKTEHIHYDREGNARHVEVHGYPVLNEEGNVAQIIEYTLDITERKEAEEALHRREQEYLALAENSPDAIVRFDRDLRRVYVNPAIETITGYPVSAFLGKTVHEPCREDRREFVKLLERTCKKVFASGEEEKFETPYLTPTGLKHFHIRVVPECSDDGRVETILTIYRDITERKQMEEELRRTRDELEVRVKERTAELENAIEALRLNEARIEALLELSQMSDASIEQIAGFVMEQQVKLTQSRIGWLGFTNEDESVLSLHTLSKSVGEQCTIPEEAIHFPVEIAGMWAHAIRERRPIIINDYSDPHPHKRGCPEGHVELTRFMVIPIFEGERIAAVAAVGNKEQDYNASDVRQSTLLMDGLWKVIQRRRAEEALRESERLAALGRAFAGLAHDMKTPLIAIGGFTRLVQRHLEANRPLFEKLDIVVSETERLEKMVKDMLDFSRPMELDLSKEDVEKLVEECVEIAKPVAHERDVCIERRVDRDLPPVLLDSCRIKQAVINLVVNAAQASPEGESVVVASYRNHAKLFIDVSDRGPGVPPEKRGEIFSPFFTTKKEGTGLGLSIVKKIIEAHGGRITVLSNPDKGATFRVELPCRKESSDGHPPV